MIELPEKERTDLNPTVAEVVNNIENELDYLSRKQKSLQEQVDDISAMKSRLCHFLN